MHDFLKKPHRRHVKEIPLAPILDLLTVVIFFLILSTSFIELRQNILPPSSTITTEATPSTEVKSLPLNPKLIIGKTNKDLLILLSWGGERPGKEYKTFPLEGDHYNLKLKNNIQEIVKNFKQKFPLEKSLQLGWSANLNYQTVLNVVDGAIVEIKDLVFISPEETEGLFQKGVQ
jgi:biopolymer transport protein ExbD